MIGSIGLVLATLPSLVGCPSEISVSLVALRSDLVNSPSKIGALRRHGSPADERRWRMQAERHDRALARWERGERKGIVAELSAVLGETRGETTVGLALADAIVATEDRSAARRFARRWTRSGARQEEERAILKEFVQALGQRRVLRPGRAPLLPPEDEARLDALAAQEFYFTERYERAEALYAVAAQLDPRNREAREGLEAVRERLRRSPRSWSFEPVIEADVRPDPALPTITSL